MPTIDIVVLILYFVGITAYGLWISRNTRSSDGYFRGGRKLKWWTMMGQAFGTGTHAEMPVIQAGASFQGGFGTIWYQWKNLLITPFYWLLAPWYRRSERTTVAEMVRDRYGTRMGLLYTIFAILFFVFIMGVMLQGAAKVISVATGGLISANWVVVGMTLAFILYSYFGGLVAAAHTEFIQGLLIIVLSFLLIPYGLMEVGGYGEMRTLLPKDFFRLFGEEYGLDGFTIFMLAINGVVGITAQPHMMSMFASGDSEIAGRVGQTYGNFAKRFVTIGWTLTGMIVAAVVIQKGVELEDPEHAFGYATRLLLAPGLVGLMIACILAANMSSCSNFMVNLGALFAKDLYQTYFRPAANDQQLLRAGRLAGLILTLAGVGFALYIDNVLSAFLFAETMAAFIGIIIFGGTLWRGANRHGALMAIIIALVTYYTLNYLDNDGLQLVYKWKAVPFAWSMLAGFAALIFGSMLTVTDHRAGIDAYFERLKTPASDDMDGEDALRGKSLILLDVGTWFSAGRWKNFASRYRDDWLGFLLAWLFVGVLIGIAWIILQL
ncbi:MAG: sodium:solute symporter family protein [Saprospiraceae bacterium]|nr:sodium:solute symporter family protein [Saprospiraceae bacterium]